MIPGRRNRNRNPRIITTSKRLHRSFKSVLSAISWCKKRFSRIQRNDFSLCCYYTVFTGGLATGSLCMPTKMHFISTKECIKANGKAYCTGNATTIYYTPHKILFRQNPRSTETFSTHPNRPFSDS